MTQLNTPYPSTAYLTGFLRGRGYCAAQADLALGLVLELLTADGLEALAAVIRARKARDRSALEKAFLARIDRYRRTIDPVIAFLQGRDSTLAYRIVGREFLPEAGRFESLAAYAGDQDPLGWAFGALGLQDRARHLATLYLNDIADVVKAAVDPGFEFVRYGERLAASQASFQPLQTALQRPAHLLDQILQRLTRAQLELHQPDLVLLSVPFPGAVYGALQIAATVRELSPKTRIVLGGGYVNTELRELAEPLLFDYVDYVTLDGGEAPLLALIEHWQGKRESSQLVRCFLRDGTTVRYCDQGDLNVAFADVGTPTWDGLPLDRYLSLLDMLNPMHRLWSDGRWNKLTVAHGCYWKKCSFCDVSLDYISRYETASATVLVDRIEAIVAETKQRGFHFVDEAAPPKALKALADELLRRDMAISWWGNIRFEKSFTPQVCRLLADSGCIAVSGGLEVASDRLLALMKKGVSVAQVARVTRAFSDAGILVHAYLMYGFPTQTLQETVDSLEYVRQLFEQGCLQSGFFHRFTCTVHSPVGLAPEAYGVSLLPLPEGRFAKNDIGFIDPSGVDHEVLGQALSTALYNYMHGVALDRPVRDWFSDVLPRQRVPKTTVSSDYIERALAATQS